MSADSIPTHFLFLPSHLSCLVSIQYVLFLLGTLVFTKSVRRAPCTLAVLILPPQHTRIAALLVHVGTFVVTISPTS